MPSAPEILGLLIVILIIWILVKVARLAFRLIVVFILIVMIAVSAYWLFVR